MNDLTPGHPGWHGSLEGEPINDTPSPEPSPGTEKEKDMTLRGGFQRIDHIPSHKSPPDDGIVYCTVNRTPYRLMGGIYTDGELRKGLNVPDDMQLWVVVPGHDDVLVEDATVTMLTSGRRFFTTPRYING